MTIESENPEPWISARAWSDILITSNLPKFENFYKSYQSAEEIKIWREYFESASPQTAKIPGKWETELNSFQKLLILKCLRPDKLLDGVQNYIAEQMGQRFIEPQTVKLDEVFDDSTPSLPLVFVLSAGTDPADNLNTFAKKMKMDKKLSMISLGQGQGPRAEAAFYRVVLLKCDVLREKTVNLGQKRSFRCISGAFQGHFR